MILFAFLRCFFRCFLCRLFSFAVGRRADVVNVLEAFGEVAWRTETDAVCNLRDVQFRVVACHGLFTGKDVGVLMGITIFQERDAFSNPPGPSIVAKKM